MNYILDTNICIYIIKRKPLSVFEKLKQIPVGQVGISVITLAELEYGARKSANPEKNREALQQFILPFELFSFDFHCTIEYGKIRSELEKKGTPIGPLDMLIAAHAMRLKAVLVTNNEKEFNRVLGLQVENWVS